MVLYEAGARGRNSYGGGGVSTKASENMTLKLRDLRNIQKFAK